MRSPSTRMIPGRTISPVSTSSSPAAFRVSIARPFIGERHIMRMSLSYLDYEVFTQPRTASIDPRWEKRKRASARTFRSGPTPVSGFDRDSVEPDRPFGTTRCGLPHGFLVLGRDLGDERDRVPAVAQVEDLRAGGEADSVSATGVVVDEDLHFDSPSAGAYSRCRASRPRRMKVGR